MHRTSKHTYIHKIEKYFIVQSAPHTDFFFFFLIYSASGKILFLPQGYERLAKTWGPVLFSWLEDGTQGSSASALAYPSGLLSLQMARSTGSA